jgi:perosamine synthetase
VAGTNSSAIAPFRTSFTTDEIAQVISDLKEILASGRLILGPYTEAFESAFAQIAGTRFAIAVNSGTSALEIICRAAGLAGQTVLVPTNTNFATAAAPIYAGARVVLYDSGLFPDLDSIASKIKNAQAVVVVHIGGYITPEILQLGELCRSAGVLLIEDAAHAHGSSFEGKPAGALGDVAAFSFYPTKVITTFEGGIVATNSEQLAAAARQYRDQGKASSSKHVVMGNSWRMSEIGAALGLAQLRSFAQDTDHRRSVMSRYAQALAGSDVRFPAVDTRSRQSGYKAIALVESQKRRTDLVSSLMRSGISLAGSVYDVPLHHQPALRPFGSGDGDDRFPTATDFCSRHICLPVWRSISDQEVDRIIDGMHKAMG